jgi:hypothetical protein
MQTAIDAWLHNHESSWAFERLLPQNDSPALNLIKPGTPPEYVMVAHPIWHDFSPLYSPESDALGDEDTAEISPDWRTTVALQQPAGVMQGVVRFLLIFTNKIYLKALLCWDKSEGSLPKGGRAMAFEGFTMAKPQEIPLQA